MVRILIALRADITRNQLARGSTWAIWAAVAFGLLSAGGTLSIGIIHGPQVDGSADRVSAVLLLWLGGQLAQATGVLVAGTLTHDSLVSWLGVAVAALTATGSTVLLGSFMAVLDGMCRS